LTGRVSGTERGKRHGIRRKQDAVRRLLLLLLPLLLPMLLRLPAFFLALSSVSRYRGCLPWHGKRYNEERTNLRAPVAAESRTPACASRRFLGAHICNPMPVTCIYPLSDRQRAFRVWLAVTRHVSRPRRPLTQDSHVLTRPPSIVDVNSSEEATSLACVEIDSCWTHGILGRKVFCARLSRANHEFMFLIFMCNHHTTYAYVRPCNFNTLDLYYGVVRSPAGKEHPVA